MKARITKSKNTLLIAGLLGILLAYLLASLAIDSGSWWHYLGTAITAYISVRLLVAAYKTKKINE